jgi:predicted metal-dependent hydrolase
VSDGYVHLKHTLSALALDALRHPRRARLAAALVAYARASSRGEPVPLRAVAAAAGMTPQAARRLLLRTGLFVAPDRGRAVALSAGFHPAAPYFYRQAPRLAEALRLAGSPSPSGVPRVIWNAASLFDAGLFFECHEYMEDAWRAAEEPERTFYHGLVQAAAGCYHLEKGTLHGARTLTGKAIAKLRPYAPAYLGVDVAALLRGLEGILDAVEAAPPRLPRRRSDLPAMRLAAPAAEPARPAARRSPRTLARR